MDVWFLTTGPLLIFWLMGHSQHLSDTDLVNCVSLVRVYQTQGCSWSFYTRQCNTAELRVVHYPKVSSQDQARWTGKVNVPNKVANERIELANTYSIPILASLCC